MRIGFEYRAEAIARHHDATEERVFVIDAVSLFVLGGFDRRHQWDQMVFLRMSDTRSRSAIPGDEALAPSCRIGVAQRVVQPIIEGPGRTMRRRSHLPQVVIAQTAADDEHTFFTQR